MRGDTFGRSPLRRTLTAPLAFALLLALSACAVYVAGPAAMPQVRAIEIASGYTREHGFNVTGTRYAVYNGRRGFWKVSLWLGAPTCGAVKVNIDAYNGRAFDFVPFVRPCGGPPPVIEEDRQDL